MTAPAARRAARIAGTFARGAVRFAGRAAAHWVRGRPSAVARAAGETLAETLVRLGPTFVKGGQILATRHDLLPPAAIAPLQRLYDRLPPAPPGTFEAAVAQLGAEPREAFAEWDPVPVASASVASVYRARLSDGRPVAVKVLRPGVAQLVRTDLRLLRGAAALAERVPALRLVPVAPMVEEIAASLERQVDLRREAEANRRLSRALTHEPRVTLPALVDELSGASVLTMAFVPAAAPLDGAGAGAALNTVLRALYRMIFVEGFVHCDLHPGNLRLHPDGRAELLDFGFMAEMPYADRLGFARFFYAMSIGDGESCADIALETAAATRAGLDRAAFTAEIVRLVDTVAGTTAREFSVARFVAGLFDAMRRHGVRGTTSFTMAIVALLVLEGLAKDAGVDLDFQAEARPYLLRASLTPAPRETAGDERVQELLREHVDVAVAPAVHHARAAG